MKKIILLLQLIIASTCFAVQYRLIDGCYSTVGNYWNYNEHYTVLDNASVSISGTATMTVTGTTNYGSYSNAFIMNVTVSVENSYFDRYYYVTSNYLLDLGTDDLVDTGLHVSYRNNNPLEMYPIWVDTSNNNYHFGNGQYTLIVDEPPISWNGTFNSYITYLRNETITVPAGTFDCVTVLITENYSDDFGFTGYSEEEISFNPYIGIIFQSDYDSFYNPFEGTTSVDECTTELTSSNLIQPSIAKDETAIDFVNESISEVFQVWNDGTGALNYNASIIDGGSYFSISPPTSGSSIGSSDKNTHTIMLNRDNIDPGRTISGRVMISSAGADDSPQYIDLSAINVFPDLNGDWRIDMEDFGIFSYYWKDQGCASPDFCQGSDFNLSGAADYEDLWILFDDWLNEIVNPYLVAYWPLDNNEPNTFVSDISGNGHNGTASADTELLSAQGQVNTCFDLAGTDFVETSDDDAFSFDDSGDNPMSIVAWINISTGSKKQMIITKYDSTTGSINIEWRFLVDADNKLKFEIYDDSALASQRIISDDALALNTWNFVAVTYDSTGGSNAADGMILYINDVAVSGTTSSSGTYVAMENKASDVFIGAYTTLSGSITSVFDGKIDNVMVFNTDLSAAAIAGFYN